MYTKNTSSSAPAAQGPVGHKLAFAFENFEPKVGKGRKAEATRQVTNTAANIDLRECSLADRQILNKGTKIMVFVDGVRLTTIPRPVFIATSTKPELIVGNSIKLTGIDGKSVYALTTYLCGLISSTRQGLRMPVGYLPLKDKLVILSTSKALGLETYIDSVYRDCEYRIRNELLSYENIDLLTTMASEQTRLFYIVAKSLAERVRANDIPDPEDFKAYLKSNKKLDGKIKNILRQLAEEDKAVLVEVKDGEKIKK